MLDELNPGRWSDHPHTLASVLPAVGAALDIWTPTKLALPPARDVVLLLVDGLGSLLLDEHAASAPHLAALPNTTLRAGFPATTATSITSLTSGTACGVHGIVGYSFRPEDDARTRGSRRVLNALRWSLDQADGPSALVTYPPSLISPHEGILDGLDDAGVRITYVMPGEFRGTGLTQVAFGAPGRHLPAVTPDGIRSAITSVLARRSRQRRLIYAYYSDLDTAGHLHGPGSDQWLAKLRIVDRLVADLVGGLPPDTTLLVTGDHGMITARDPVDIDTTPILLDGTDAVAGEARVRHVYAVDGAAADVADAWSAYLGDRAVIATREQAIDEDWFGPRVSARITARIGDVVAVARDHTTLIRTRHEPLESRLLGHHGAWTAAEQLVPLLMATSGRPTAG